MRHSTSMAALVTAALTGLVPGNHVVAQTPVAPELPQIKQDMQKASPVTIPAQAPVTDCDRLAGTSRDPDNVGLSVNFDAIEAKEAVKACVKAVEQYASERRLQFQLGRAYDADQNAAKAIEWYGRAAQLGSVSAMYNLGYIYESGQEVAQDFAKAAEFYGKAALAGDAEARRNLGVLFANGTGVAQSDRKAFGLFAQAAMQDDVVAQYNLGIFFRDGTGTGQNFGKAAQWLLKSANGGDYDAQRSLAELYEHGLGVTQDLVLAKDWYGKAAEQGDEDAAAALQRLQSE